MSWPGEQGVREQVLGLLPGAATLFDDLYQGIWRQPYIAASTLELCRLRLAQLHGSATDWQRSEYPLDQQKKDSLSQWSSSPLYSDAERACLELAEIYAMDPSAITDSQADAVKASYGEAGLVALVEALGLFDGLTRMSLLWQLEAASTSKPQPGEGA